VCRAFDPMDFAISGYLLAQDHLLVIWQGMAGPQRCIAGTHQTLVVIMNYSPEVQSSRLHVIAESDCGSAGECNSGNEIRASYSRNNSRAWNLLPF
jgi:hypothetical protein